MLGSVGASLVISPDGNIVVYTGKSCNMMKSLAPTEYENIPWSEKKLLKL